MKRCRARDDDAGVFWIFNFFILDYYLMFLFQSILRPLFNCVLLLLLLRLLLPLFYEKHTKKNTNERISSSAK